MFVSGCTEQVTGQAQPVTTPTGTVRAAERGEASHVDVEAVLLGAAQMRAVTDSASLVVSTTGKAPIVIADVVESVPPGCRFLFSDDSTFGPDREDFRKNSYQIPPPHGASISEGAAAYDGDVRATKAFSALRAAAIGCADSSYGRFLVGEWRAEADALRMRVGTCGRDYRLKSSVLVEVTFCGFPEATTEIVMSDILSRVSPLR